MPGCSIPPSHRSGGGWRERSRPSVEVEEQSLLRGRGFLGPRRPDHEPGTKAMVMGRVARVPNGRHRETRRDGSCGSPDRRMNPHRQARPAVQFNRFYRKGRDGSWGGECPLRPFGYNHVRYCAPHPAAANPLLSLCCLCSIPAGLRSSNCGQHQRLARPLRPAPSLSKLCGGGGWPGPGGPRPRAGTSPPGTPRSGPRRSR